MNKITQQFSELRESTPKHVQWLLLAAAFVIVLILLTLLIGGWRKKTDDIKNPDDDKLQLFVDPAETLDWSDTTVGDEKTQKFLVTASAPVKILKVRINSDVAGLSTMDQCSTATMTIDQKNGCMITVKYAPTANMVPTGASLFVDWRGARETDSLKKTEKITLVLGAVAKKVQPVQEEIKPEPKPAPAPAPLPEPEPEPAYEPEPVFMPEPEPIPVKDEIKQNIEAIAPSLPAISTPKPVSEKTPEPAKQKKTESCSDFAFPGYGTSGQQTGWIRPEHGSYYFHPFSDKNCNNPTGIYNPDNGIISDINDASKKIGTDAEHIGYSSVSSGTLPNLSSVPKTKTRANIDVGEAPVGEMGQVALKVVQSDVEYTSTGDAITNTAPHDRSFILRQYKPIPATIVSEIRADPEALKNNTIPVRATVDRNVYADNGRTVIIPTGTLLMGYVTGNLPGPYTSIGRMEIKWYQFILPNGVEFNFQGNDPFSADAQGRVGVPGRGSTDYMEQFIMPMLTAIVPAAVNLIAPVADKFVNQIDLDNNTVVQSGTVRSSELAKNEIITAWNQVAQKLMVDMMDNTTPPFSIAAGTRITVYSPVDLQLTCGDPASHPGKKCAIVKYSDNQRRNPTHNFIVNYTDGSWIGQVRSFNWSDKYCTGYDQGKGSFNDATIAQIYSDGLDYSSVLFYCQSNQYKAINNAKQEAVWQNQNSAQNTNSVASMGGVGSQTYNEKVLGLKYNEETGAIVNPFQSLPKEKAPATITCEDGTNPDENGCCTGEVYTDMGDQGFNCCPETGGDCFPPIL